ncbi:hypothetical protein [Pseudonocardia spinosispora]|uniref:hypothetical protein n=1 Tax=Pseudonocardia spinosispora TaxID=103441 RepID=UPI0012EB870E|nr:hypothetical protein [Pseudonocardia spinosispora]
MATQGPSSRVYEYTFWELDEVGQHAIFAIDGRDYESNQIAYARVLEASDECDSLGVRLAEFEMTEQTATAPRSPLPTWQEYRATLVKNRTEDDLL